MFGLTKEDLAFVFIIFFLAAIAYVLRSTYSERTEYAEDLSKEQLKSLVYSLAKSLKDSKEEDERLRQKIEDLQFSDSLQREQTKFLTANVNKTATTV
tara:strand:+ start:3878 stop:4171 length:294 start_codon:yes stop_codon:yes gene_type:complete